MTDIESTLTGNNVSARIRAYVAEHPNIGARAVADALGLAPHTVSNTCGKMARRGLLTATRISAEASATGRVQFTYRAGRTELVPREERGPLATAARMRSTAALRPFLQDLVRKPDPVAYNATPAQSVDEWLAQGNVPEVLPGFQYSIPRVIQVGARW